MDHDAAVTPAGHRSRIGSDRQPRRQAL